MKKFAKSDEKMCDFLGVGVADCDRVTQWIFGCETNGCGKFCCGRRKALSRWAEMV